MAASALHHFSSLQRTSSAKPDQPRDTRQEPQAASEAGLQASVASALAQGKSVTAAAREAGIHRTTIHHWQRTSAEFRAALDEARDEFIASLRDDLRDLSYAAIGTLQELMSNPNTPPSVRLKTALAVLERPRFPKRSWNLPERIETDRERYVVDGVAELETDYQIARMTESIRKHDEANAPAIDDSTLPFSASGAAHRYEPAGPATAAEPRPAATGSEKHRAPAGSIHQPHACHDRRDAQPARNSLCPCGSGQKYKRCCGRNAPPVIC